METPGLNQLHVLLHRLLLTLWYLHARDQLSALLRQSGCFSLVSSWAVYIVSVQGNVKLIALYVLILYYMLYCASYFLQGAL